MRIVFDKRDYLFIPSHILRPDGGKISIVHPPIPVIMPNVDYFFGNSILAGASGSQTVITIPGSGDYTGATGDFTIGTGTLDSSASDKAIYVTNTISGDFDVTLTLTEADGRTYPGVFDADEISTFLSTQQAGQMEDMTNSFWIATVTNAGLSTEGTHRGAASDVAFSWADGEVALIERRGSTITCKRDGSVQVTWTSTNTDAMHFCVGTGNIINLNLDAIQITEY